MKIGHKHDVSILTGRDTNGNELWLTAKNLNTKDTIEWIKKTLLEKNGLVWNCSPSHFFEYRTQRGVHPILKQMIKVQTIS